MANNVLPARTGELYRAHFLGRRATMSRSGVAGSIVVERTLDGLMLVAMILLVFFLFPQNEFLSGAAQATGLVFLVLAIGISLYSLATERVGRLVDHGLLLLPQMLRERFGGRLEFFLRGIRGISTTKGLLRAGFYTVCAWSLEACAVALVLGAFQISVTLSGFVLVYALSALSTTIPAGPGYVGPYQYAFVLSLGASGVSQEAALAASLAVQVALFGPVTVIGLVLLWREQLRTRAGS